MEYDPFPWEQRNFCSKLYKTNQPERMRVKEFLSPSFVPVDWFYIALSKSFAVPWTGVVFDINF